MRNAPLPVAELLVEKPDAKPEVMQQQEDETPFEKRDIETFHPPRTESPGIVDILTGEEISGRYEEERHVENIDEIAQQIGHLGVAYHHQDDGDSLAD